VDEFAALLGIVAALSVGVVSPGPSFVMVARVAVGSSRARGLTTALGMGTGGTLFGAAALLGLQSVFSAVPALYLGLKILGGIYLCYVGFLVWRSAPRAIAVADGTGPSGKAVGSFWLGLTTQLSNPKTAIVYASVFAAFLPPRFSLAFGAAVLLAVFAIETAWYALVAIALSSPAPQRAYLACKTWVDRSAGLVMVGLGLKLATDAVR
jgi:threonine/homoserine/homoserine lactone efflux protein